MDTVRIVVASTGKEFDLFSKAFDPDSYKSNDTITFLTDATVDAIVTIAKKCTIDLGGHFLFVPMPNAITVKNGVTVNIINGRIQTLSSKEIEDVIVVQGSKTILELGSDLEIDAFGTAVHVRRRGSLVVDRAQVRSRGSQPTVYLEDVDSTVVVNHGEIASYERSAIVNRNSGKIIVNGGSIRTESNGLVPETTYPAILVDGQKSELIVHDGEIFSTKSPAVVAQSSSEITVNGGTIYTESDNYNAVEVQDSYTKLTVAGGWIYSRRTSAILTNKVDYGEVQTIQIKDGKVGGHPSVFHVAGSGDHCILVSGGAVKGYLPQHYIATGYVISDIKDDDGYAKIILKTWKDPEDQDPVFPSETDTEFLDNNPFDSVSDPDVETVVPFPPADIASDGTVEESSDVVFAYTAPAPYPPLPLVPITEDPYTPPEIREDEISPVVSIPESELDEDTCPAPGPMPQPGPRPGPCPGPHQEDVNNILHDSSINIRKPVYIYKTPSRKTVITEWKGALTIVSAGYYNRPDGDEFAMVKFRLPGSGRTTTGYALVYDLSNHQ